MQQNAAYIRIQHIYLQLWTDKNMIKHVTLAKSTPLTIHYMINYTNNLKFEVFDSKIQITKESSFGLNFTMHGPFGSHKQS